MKGNQFLGLVKFFRNEVFLDKLINGCFHCTPPEIYRLDTQEGVSDKYESCAYSYRPERGDEHVTISIKDININDALGMTIHNGSNKDAWMHCWFTLRLPKDPEALDKLKEDVTKMKNLFGKHYAFIPAHNLKPLVSTLEELSEKKLFCGEVVYSGDESKWGNLVKSLEYSYQREYRFLFGECSPSETDFYIFNKLGGFSDLILKNADLKLQSKDGKDIWFELRA
ncbi:hypothetical protein [Plesiomonas shigelloides]|uniref:hypothetical protein n=1 Tax=Plesiomonas shigelloides TaxID=703 RepID=UPI0012618EAA|nr:hypothetical protein [Plesiomonas shigelloides]KAB7668787.1 hypothetical protein GBN25_03005 [Plesiomonas shigelloides]